MRLSRIWACRLEWRDGGVNEVGIVASSRWEHLAPGAALGSTSIPAISAAKVRPLHADISKAAASSASGAAVVTSESWSR